MIEGIVHYLDLLVDVPISLRFHRTYQGDCDCFGPQARNIHETSKSREGFRRTTRLLKEEHLRLHLRQLEGAAEHTWRPAAAHPYVAAIAIAILRTRRH